MDIELRHLRAFVAVIDEGTFTDAAIALDLSQATVSRTIASFEDAVGARVLHRTAREVGLTAVGARLLPAARQVLDDVGAMARLLGDVTGDLRIGYAWGALGDRTTELQQRWAAEMPGSHLVFVQSVSRAAGLEDGLVDLAVVRRPVDPARYESALIGFEQRYAAVPADDVLARQQRLSLHDFVGRTIAIDEVTGTTTTDLWPADTAPASTRSTRGVDPWLAAIASGECVGLTSEATVQQHPRPGVVYRPVRDAPPLPVWLAWPREGARPGTAALVRMACELYGG